MAKEPFKVERVCPPTLHSVLFGKRNDIVNVLFYSRGPTEGGMRLESQNHI